MNNIANLKTTTGTALLVIAFLSPFSALAQRTSAAAKNGTLFQQKPTIPAAATKQWSQIPVGSTYLQQGKTPAKATTFDAKSNSKFNQLRVVKEGGVGSGGGTGYQGGLLDLALFNTGAFNDRTPGTTLATTRAFQKVGFDRLNTSSLPVLRKAHSQVLKWFSSSPEMASRIAKALQTTPIYFMQGTIENAPLGYALPANSSIRRDELSTLGVYIETIGNFTSKKSFEALSEKNQMAYLIHESLRHMQIDNQSKISNVNLQKLTAQIMQDPEGNQTIDTAEFMAGPILEQVRSKQGIIASNKETTDKACTKYGRLCGESMASTEELIVAADQLSDITKSSYEAGKISFDQYQDDTVMELELRATATLLIASGLSNNLAEVQEPVFRVNHGVKFGVMDEALSDINSKGSSSKEKTALLKKISALLAESGLIK